MGCLKRRIFSNATRCIFNLILWDDMKRPTENGTYVAGCFTMLLVDCFLFVIDSFLFVVDSFLFQGRLRGVQNPQSSMCRSCLIDWDVNYDVIIRYSGNQRTHFIYRPKIPPY